MMIKSPIKYRDGSLSREIDEDWEATGNEDYEKALKACKGNFNPRKAYLDEPQKSLQDIEEDLLNAITLLDVCNETLKKSTLFEMKVKISDTINYFVKPVLEEVIQNIHKHMENDDDQS